MGRRLVQLGPVNTATLTAIAHAATTVAEQTHHPFLVGICHGHGFSLFDRAA